MSNADTSGRKLRTTKEKNNDNERRRHTLQFLSYNNGSRRRIQEVKGLFLSLSLSLPLPQSLSSSLSLPPSLCPSLPLPSLPLPFLSITSLSPFLSTSLSPFLSTSLSQFLSLTLPPSLYHPSSRPLSFSLLSPFPMETMETKQGRRERTSPL